MASRRTPAERRTPEPAGNAGLRLKVTLQGVQPPPWRCLVVPATVTLDQLHDILQIACGWQDCHLHGFAIGRDRYSPDLDADDFGFGTPDLDELGVRLVDAVERAASGARQPKIVYTYDYGDDWEHLIVIEKPTAGDAGLELPACIDGERAWPPEDCGGWPGYARLLEILADPRDEEHEEMLEWLGEAFDPDGFDAAAVNADLRREFRRRKPRRKAARRR